MCTGYIYGKVSKSDIVRGATRFQGWGGGPIPSSRVWLPSYKKVDRSTQFGAVGYIIGFYSSKSYVKSWGGGSVQILGRSGPPDPPVVAPMDIAVRGITTSLREITSNMESHSVTCHPAEVTFPPLPQPKLVLSLALEKCKAELTWMVVVSQHSLPI